MVNCERIGRKLAAGDAIGEVQSITASRTPTVFDGFPITNIPILPRGDHGSNVGLIRNSGPGARYPFGITHNQTQRVGKNE
jgi:hypothetical protein